MSIFAWLLCASLASASPVRLALEHDTTEWTDERGEALHFAPHFDRALVVTAAYSQCRKTCPLVTYKKLVELQSELDRRKKSAEFFIVTLDPEQDGTSVLERWKKRWGDHANWHFIRAEKKATDRFLSSLGLDGYWRMDDHIQHGFKILYFGSEADSVRSLDWNQRDVQLLFQ